MGIFPVRYSGFDGSDRSGMARCDTTESKSWVVTKVSLKSCTRCNVCADDPEVSFKYVAFSWLTTFANRVPVQNIHVNTTTTVPPTSTAPPTSSHFAAEARVIVGGIMGLLLVVGIVAFIFWRRWRRHIRIISAPSSTAMRSASGIGLTPFILTHPDATHGDQASWVGLQRPQSGSPEAVGANADADGPSSSSIPSTNSGPFPFIPIGLSAKMLACMRAETSQASRPRPIYRPPTLDVSGSQSPPPSVPAIERRPATSLPMFRTMHARFDHLWREMQQLRAEVFNSEAPPSYAEGNAVEGTRSHG